jgi:hypothetical protein
MGQIKVVFGIDENGEDIFVIQKANMFKVLYEEPREWIDLFQQFNLSHQEMDYVQEMFEEWKNWYKRIRG